MREFQEFIPSDQTGALLAAFCEQEQSKGNGFTITCFTSAPKPQSGLIVSYTNHEPCEPPVLPKRI